MAQLEDPLWRVTSCSLVDTYCYFIRTCHLYSRRHVKLMPHSYM